jgi:hypothetical protein
MLLWTKEADGNNPRENDENNIISLPKILVNVKR